MPPAAIGPMKAMMTELDLAKLQAVMDDALKDGGAEIDLRARLHAFAEENNIPL